MRTLVVLALVGIGCGPQVPFGDDDGTGDDDDGNGDRDDDGDPDAEVGGEIGGDPSDPSNPSDPSDPTFDPDSDTGATDPTTPTSGPIDGCGDGVLDPGEECDDGDVEDGDACSSSCTIAFDLLWSVSIDGAGSFDVANDVVLAADGTAYVVGSMRVGSPDLMVQQVFADGGLGFTWLWDGAESLADEALAVAWTPSGQLAITGSTESMATGDDILVMVFDPGSQSMVWSRVFDGPGSGAGEYDEIDVGNDVGVDPDGNVVVAATMRVGPGDYDVWVAELTADGGDAWSLSYAGGAGERDDANAVLVDAMGQVTVVAERDEGAESFLWLLDGVGGAYGEGLPFEFTAIDAATSADAWTAIAGVEEEDFGDADAWTSLHDRAWFAVWSQPFQGTDEWTNGVAISAAHDVVTVGTRAATGEQDNAWVIAYRADGSPWWGDTYNNDDSDLGDAFFSAAIASDGTVIAVGSETVIGQQTNVLVRRYQPY